MRRHLLLLCRHSGRDDAMGISSICSSPSLSRYFRYCPSQQLLPIFAGYWRTPRGRLAIPLSLLAPQNPFTSFTNSTHNTHELHSRAFQSALKREKIRDCSVPCRPTSRMGSLAGSANLHLDYPDARRDDSVVDDYHGTPISDPYRWMEDPEAAETKEFVEKQIALTNSILEKCETRHKLNERITALYDYPKYDCPFIRRGKYFYFYNKGLEPQSVLYVQESLESEAQVLLDPNTLSDDGTVSLPITAVSNDAKHLACGISKSGSDWMTIKLLRVEDRTFAADDLSWVKFSSIRWTHDHRGFFYSRYPAPAQNVGDAGTETNINLHHQVFYHYVGTDQAEDILCWSDPEHPRWLFGADITDDGKYLILTIDEGCDPVNRLYYCDLTTLQGGLEAFKGTGKLLPFQKLVDNFDAQYQLIANDETVFTFLTNKDAPKYKVTRVDLRNPSAWTDVIPESDADVLTSVDCVHGDQLVVCYLRDVKHVLQRRSLKTGALLQQLPLEIGTVSRVSGERKDREVFFHFTNFLSPGTIYRCDLESENPSPQVFRESTVTGFDRNGFETRQVFVPSKDGTKVPMFLVTGTANSTGEGPTLLYGYGGFNISLTPYFSAARVALIRHYGGVFAMANIRGGGEYGEEWHKGGALAHKQNCFDDFHACAEYLIQEGITSPSKLCIEGGSNGGLLVAACVNQRPELFGCALAHVGVMDMLRFHRFTIGHAWTSDYGCADNAEDFETLIKYSPLHNVKRPWEEAGKEGVQYPPMMLLTADHDDRVVPLHTLKLLATLQFELYKGKGRFQTNPILGRIDSKAGHGAGRPTQKIIEQTSDAYAFMAMVSGSSWRE